MKISLDGGALCASPNKRFGNYIFSQNLIKSINLFDKKNEYFIYSFCEKPADLVLNKNVVYKQIGPKKFWLRGRVSLEEIRGKNNIFFALNQAIPLLTRSRIFSFSHGLSFHFYKELYPDSYFSLKKQLENFVRRSEKIIVSSEKVKRELLELYPNKKNIEVLPFGVSLDLIPYVNKKQKKEKLFIFVGTNHPIKNINFIEECFNKFKKDKRFKEFKLKIITRANRKNLISDYSKAKALLTASLYESFNLPVLEALALGTNVIGLKAAIIPELEKYVSTADNKDKFMQYMVLAAQGRLKPVNIAEIKSQFSWKNYVAKLTSIY